MAEEEYDFVPYKDISELKKELEGMKGKKDVSTKEIYDAVEKLAQTVADMLEVFGAAAEQLKLEEKEYDSDAKKHEAIISKLDKIIDQNKTIAEGLVAIVEMVKEKLVAPAKEVQEPVFRQNEEALFRSVTEPKPFIRPQQEWRPRPKPVMPSAQQAMTPPPMPNLPPPLDFGMQMPPMELAPLPDFDPAEELFPAEEQKKKGLFGIFKK